MNQSSKRLLKCLHAGYLARYQHAYQVDPKRYPDGAWSGMKFTYDSPTTPSKLIANIDDFKEKGKAATFTLLAGQLLEDDGLITGVPGWTYMYCLTPKGVKEAIAMFGPAVEALFVHPSDR